MTDECKGTVYVVGGKSFCVGEKNISMKQQINSRKSRKARKNKKRKGKGKGKGKTKKRRY